MSGPTTLTATSPSARRVRLTRTAAVLGAVVASLLANLVLWGVGLAVGGDFMMTDADGTRASAAPGGVILMTVAPLAVGMTVAVALSRLWAPILRVAAAAGAEGSADRDHLQMAGPNTLGVPLVLAAESYLRPRAQP